ncbi:MAG: heme ABC transporter permease CcmB, partial [Chloroflexi bacterium]|nr:heme ABC transporter permease CcmB [Chloroflexota bacterium]
EAWSSLTSWLGMIIAFDVIFAVACFLVFAFIIEE